MPHRVRSYVVTVRGPDTTASYAVRAYDAAEALDRVAKSWVPLSEVMFTSLRVAPFEPRTRKDHQSEIEFADPREAFPELSGEPTDKLDAIIHLLVGLGDVVHEDGRGIRYVRAVSRW